MIADQPLPDLADRNQEDEEDQDVSDESESDSDSDSSASSFAGVSSCSDNDDMAGTKIGIPKFTGQETDVSDKARDWLTGLETYFTEKGVAEGAQGWTRRCGLIRWSLVSDSIPEGKDYSSASSWFKANMEDDDLGGRAFVSDTRWITGTPLEEVSNIFRCLNQSQKETIREYSERIMRDNGRLMRLGATIMQIPDAHETRWRQAFEWLNIIVLMGGLQDEFLNHVKRAVGQLPIDQRTWDTIRDIAAVQQDHESNHRTRTNSFSKGGSINYAGRRARSVSPGARGGGGSGGGSSGSGNNGGGMKKQHWREKPTHRPS